MNSATTHKVDGDAAATSACPSDDELRQLAAGHLPDADQAALTSHLAPRPQGPAGRDRLMADGARPATPQSALRNPHSPALLHVIDQIKAESPTTRFGSGSTDGDSPAPLDFL